MQKRSNIAKNIGKINAKINVGEFFLKLNVNKGMISRIRIYCVIIDLVMYVTIYFMLCIKVFPFEQINLC